ncbi:AAA family ATPase [Anditalea andensis]|uniref:Adenylate kinase n=1 Tax=Anditalea andensis TaxID=1048983 RepID=A0A074L0C6_9BACT|nr:AAA family ATPase [Anditalea andensis]KEO75676.1 adenylate kinase [Anditalea andensis]
MKLHILGASGSGVTTLGQLLGKKLGVIYFDSDDYFWIKTEPPFTHKRTPNERNQLIGHDISKLENWILGGSIINWGDNIFPNFDLIIFLYLPHEIRMERLKKRELERYGDSLYADPNKARQFNDFIAWAADYDYATGLANRTLAAHNIWLAQTKNPVLKIIGNKTLNEKLNLILSELKHRNIIKF